MKTFALLFLLLTLSPGQKARAESSLDMDERNGLASHGALQPGETLRFPRGFYLPDFSAERGLATRIIKGTDGGKPYACAFAIEADTEVRFPEFTHWTVIKNEVDGDVTRLSLAHDTWGNLRPLEFRCAGLGDVNQALMDQHVSLPVEVPVEHISD